MYENGPRVFYIGYPQTRTREPGSPGAGEGAWVARRIVLRFRSLSFSNMSLLSAMKKPLPGTAEADGGAQPASSSAPPPTSFSAASAKASSRGRRRASALLMEQLTRELSAGGGRRRSSLQSDDGYDRMHALASVGMLDFLDSFQLGMNSRNNSLHLGRDSFSSVYGGRNSMSLGAMGNLGGGRASLTAGSHNGISAGSNSNTSSISNNGASTTNRRRSRRLSGGSASILSELAEAAKLSAAGSAWTGGGRRGSLQPFMGISSDPPQDGGLSAPGEDNGSRRFSLRVALDEMAFYANPKNDSKGEPKIVAGKSKRKKSGKKSGTKRKVRSQSSNKTGGEKKRKTEVHKRVTNRVFEARRRHRVNAAMKQLKKICVKPSDPKQGKGLTKIEVLERAIQSLRKKYKEPPMDLKTEYDAADAVTERELSHKALESGAADIRRSIRERKRRMRVNILEKEIARLALSSADPELRANASKCIILERACEVLGQPVPPEKEKK